MCARCRYPPCNVCEKVARPKKAKFSVERMPLWRCPSCSLAEKPCAHCHKLKAPEAFDKKTNRHYNQICKECQFPKCTGCGEPSKEKWIPNPRQKTEGYKCENCITRTCQGRCNKQLPADAFDRRADGHRYTVCKECQHPKCATCGQKSTEIWTPHPKIPNEVYKCSACEKSKPAGKQTKKCKTCEETDASAFDKKDRSHLYDRCRNCQYPKCSQCGQESTEIWTPNPKNPS